MLLCVVSNVCLCVFMWKEALNGCLSHLESMHIGQGVCHFIMHSFGVEGRYTYTIYT
jgi:hypothetical protein